MRKNKILSKIQGQSLYPLLQHYTGSKIISISSEKDVFFFKNSWGHKGKVVKDIDGNWQIIIGDELIDTIEKDIFNILINPDKKNSIEDYLYQLNSLINNQNIKYRSKILIAEIIHFIEDYILTSDFVPKEPLTIGPFIVFGYKRNKMINCLN